MVHESVLGTHTYRMLRAIPTPMPFVSFASLNVFYNSYHFLSISILIDSLGKYDPVQSAAAKEIQPSRRQFAPGRLRTHCSLRKPCRAWHENVRFAISAGMNCIAVHQVHNNI